MSRRMRGRPFWKKVLPRAPLPKTLNILAAPAGPRAVFAELPGAYSADFIAHLHRSLLTRRTSA